MTPPAEKTPRMETSRASLGLGLALLAASVIAVAVLLPRLAPHTPYKNLQQEPEAVESIVDRSLIHYRKAP